MKPTKSQRKKLRELIGSAYTRELNHHLNELMNKFDDWKNNRIDCWELNDLIHKFHDGISRELYKTYNYSRDEILLIARALSLNFLQEEELPLEFRESVYNTMKLFQSDNSV